MSCSTASDSDSDSESEPDSDSESELSLLITGRHDDDHQYIEQTGCLHRAQTGFLRLPRLSADMCCWLASVISQDAELSQSEQFRCFVDVKAAFASTGHADASVGRALLRVGIKGKLAQLIMTMLSHSRVYVAEDGYMCLPILATVGLIEGCVFSPLLWDIVMDSLSGLHW